MQRREFLGWVLDATLAAAGTPAFAAAAAASAPVAEGLRSDGQHDDHAALQGLLDQAQAGGGGLVQLAPQVYRIGTTLRLPPKVTLDLGGGTLRRMFNRSPRGASLMVAAPGEQIGLRNGTLDGNGAHFPAAFNLLGVEDASRLVFAGLDFLSVVDFHAIDLAGCREVQVRDCRFLGFHDRSGRRGFSEAIQLDPGIAAGGSINRDVRVSGCQFGAAANPSLADFQAWPCAMGNHFGFDDHFHSGLIFEGNLVDGADWAGLNLLNMRQVQVSGNRFNGGRHAVRLRLKDDVSPGQGCADVLITGNRFSRQQQAAVEFADPTPGRAQRVGNGRHREVQITDNTWDGGPALARVGWVAGVAITGNTWLGSGPQRHDHGISVAATASQVTLRDNRPAGS